VERLEQVQPILPNGRLRINTGSANISLRGGGDPSVHLAALKRRPENLVPKVETTPDGLCVSFERPFGWGSEESDLELTLPFGLTVEIGTSSGDLSIDDWKGKLEHRSGSGDVRILRCGGEMALRTASGDVEIREYEGPIGAATTSGDVQMEAIRGWIRLQTISGDVTIERSSGNEEIQTVSGDLSIEAWYGSIVVATTSGDLSGEVHQCPKLVASTVSGDLHLSLEPMAAGDYEVKTTSGDVRLRIPRTARLAVRMATLSGDISNELPLSREETHETTFNGDQKVGVLWLEKDWIRIGRNFSGVLNAKDGTLSVKTISGDIVLREQ
jgi:DUF4097 and DUF4098 domain-containing protein YvlB